MKAIDTEFDGHLFRSRLEARWAVFFKTLGIRYEYEKEGFDLDGIYYLPDFWLPEQRAWIEIKGQRPTAREEENAARLALHTARRVFIFFEGIPNPEEMIEYDDMYAFDLRDHGMEGATLYYENDYFLDVPESKPSKIGPEKGYVWSDCYSQHLMPRKGGQYSEPWCCEHEGSGWGGHINTPRLIAAYTAARQARFEHGAK